MQGQPLGTPPRDTHPRCHHPRIRVTSGGSQSHPPPRGQPPHTQSPPTPNWGTQDSPPGIQVTKGLLPPPPHPPPPPPGTWVSQLPSQGVGGSPGRVWGLGGGLGSRGVTPTAGDDDREGGGRRRLGDLPGATGAALVTPRLGGHPWVPRPPQPQLGPVRGGQLPGPWRSLPWGGGGGGGAAGEDLGPPAQDTPHPHPRDPRAPPGSSLGPAAAPSRGVAPLRGAGRSSGGAAGGRPGSSSAEKRRRAPSGGLPSPSGGAPSATGGRFLRGTGAVEEAGWGGLSPTPPTPGPPRAGAHSSGDAVRQARSRAKPSRRPSSRGRPLGGFGSCASCSRLL